MEPVIVMSEPQTTPDRRAGGSKTVLIDAYNLGLEKGTGVATYARNLSYVVHDIGHRVDVLYGSRAAVGMTPLMKEIAFFDQNVGEPPWWELAWRRTRQVAESVGGRTAAPVPITGTVIATPFRSRLPYFDRIWNYPDIFGAAHAHFRIYRNRLRINLPEKPQIAHWTYPIPIVMPGVKNVYTLHDLVPLRLPYTTLDNKRRYYRLTRQILQKADAIVTVSERSKKDIAQLFDFPEDKIVNTYQAVEIPAKYRDKPENLVKQEIEGTFRLKYKEYFLFFGSIEPKKNIGRLIEAYLGSGLDTPLVIVGAQAWKSEQELRLLNDQSVRYLETIGPVTLTRDRVMRLDYAPFPLLVSLIRGAKAVTFPSLYEGFGLPVLEGMLLGTPVLSSTEGSVPEVAGDAALLIDPYDPRAIAEGLRALDSDADLRGRLSLAGRKRAQLFSAERFQQRMAQVYAGL